MNSVCCWQGAENTIDLLQGFEGGVLSGLVRDQNRWLVEADFPTFRVNGKVGRRP